MYRWCVWSVRYIFDGLSLNGKSFPLRIDSSLMARRNLRQRQPSPTPSGEQSPEGSQNAPEHGNVVIPGNCASRTSRRRRRASQQSVGEAIDIALSDEDSTVSSQANSQAAPAVPPQTNNSQLARTPASSQGGSRGRAQQTSQDVRHFFRKTRGMPTVCIACE